MAAATAAAFIFGCVCVLPWSARAGDDDGLAHFILFSGRDLWRNGVFAYGGVLWAPNGLETDGFMLKTLLSGGIYRYDSGTLGTVYGGELKGQVMPGWHFKRGHFELMAFAGPDVETHKLWPDDPGNNLRGTSFGLALAAELWDQPTPETMLAADASFSTVGSNYAARIALAGTCSDSSMSGRKVRFTAATATASSASAPTSPASRPARTSGRPRWAGPSTPTSAKAPMCGSD